MKNLLEKIIEQKNYDDLGNWCLPNLGRFSTGKFLFEYQRNALKNITKVLHEYFSNDVNKKHLFELYKNHGIDSTVFEVPQYEKIKGKENKKVNARFARMANMYEVETNDTDQYICGSNLINRAGFWMATGSGKSIVLIKLIELVDYLQSQKLIPQRELMLLLPREDLIKQFQNEIAEYNQGKNKTIDLVNLKEYETDKFSKLNFSNTIKVYYYRSDLLRDERKENILDYKSYLNEGNWYVFLDEAHRGKKGGKKGRKEEDSIMQDYVSMLSKNGFLFNFSATFTDKLDYATTCYNFNLEKFILAGYGKNIYLSNSYFDFKKEKDEISEQEKQRQVMKSLLTLAFIKKSRKKGLYHNPLLITLMNSVNTENSDLRLFFAKIEEIAGGKASVKLFESARDDLLEDLREHNQFVFGDEKLDVDFGVLERLTLEDIFEQVFNAKNHGKIEILEGEKGKEIVLKLQTATKPFALIKIGDTGKFNREHLGENYSVLQSFNKRRYFEDINESEEINLLLGSRSFYEGWDSNRPNVINLINIGSENAEKYVLQGIGRGVRIEPEKGQRGRLPAGHVNKNSLLETLFIYATDKNAVKAIIETVEGEKNSDEVEISLEQNQKRPFDLLIPFYKEDVANKKPAPFLISEYSRSRFRNYLQSLSDEILLVKYSISLEQITELRNLVSDDTLLREVAENNYEDMEMLLHRLVAHASVKNKVIDGIRLVADEIIHFKHIKVNSLSDTEIDSLQSKIENVKNFIPVDKKVVAMQFAEGKITEEEFSKAVSAEGEETFKDLVIKNIAAHYYLPFIYSNTEKVEYIKHIVNVKSEITFIKNLEKFVEGKTFDFEWMFSKIDESLDKSMGIPYFASDNSYRDFYPDFIFWIKRENIYRIIFIDPKGGANAASQKKIDGFKKLFEGKNGEPTVFKYKEFEVTFELCFIGENEGGLAYDDYWLPQENFDFMNI